MWDMVVVGNGNRTLQLNTGPMALAYSKVVGGALPAADVHAGMQSSFTVQAFDCMNSLILDSNTNRFDAEWTWTEGTGPNENEMTFKPKFELKVMCESCGPALMQSGGGDPPVFPSPGTEPTKLPNGMS